MFLKCSAEKMVLPTIEIQTRERRALLGSDNLIIIVLEDNDDLGVFTSIQGEDSGMVAGNEKLKIGRD